MTPSVAVLIDGGYFLKRLPSVRPFGDGSRVDHIVSSLDRLVNGHLDKLNETYLLPKSWSMLYRIFFYDAAPYAQNAELPISKRNKNFSLTDTFRERVELFEKLRRKRNLALRLGEVVRDHGWTLTDEAQRRVLGGAQSPAELRDDDFRIGLRQKGVDMRIGLDIASISFKRQANIVVLVAGDSDFVPAAKLARREGVEFILDPMWRSVRPALFEHIDGLWSALPRSSNDAPPQ